MARYEAFGKVLGSVRREQGFQTPYAFFTSRGGRKGLGLTFANYLGLEKGKSLPKGWRLGRLLEVLGLPPHSPRARELVYAYLACVLGSEELLRGVVRAPSSDLAPAAFKLAASAAKQAIGERKVQLSLEQYRVLAKVPGAYACHILLKCTEEGIELGELARMAGAGPAVVKRAVAALKSVKLARVSGSLAKSPLANNYVTPPPLTPAFASIYTALQSQRAEWVKKHGSVVFNSYLQIRTRPDKIENYFNHLADAVNMSAIYADNEKREGSDIYLTEARVVRLFSTSQAKASARKG